MRTAMILSLWALMLPVLNPSESERVISDAPAYPTISWQELPQGRIIEVVDSDTLKIELPAAGVTLEVDLAGVHGPGLRQPFGPEAAFFIKSLAQGEQVRVSWTDEGQPDARGRRSGVVYREPDGMCLNLELVRAGLAEAKTGSLGELDATIEAYAARAKSLGRGWVGGEEPMTDLARAATPKAGDEEPIEAHEHQTGPANASEAEAQKLFVTRSGSKYHRASCRFVTDSAIEITLEEASGRYDPCLVCHPPTLTPPTPTPPTLATPPDKKKPK